LFLIPVLIFIKIRRVVSEMKPTDRRMAARYIPIMRSSYAFRARST